MPDPTPEQLRDPLADLVERDRGVGAGDGAVVGRVHVDDHDAVSVHQFGELRGIDEPHRGRRSAGGDGGSARCCGLTGCRGAGAGGKQDKRGESDRCGTHEAEAGSTGHRGAGSSGRGGSVEGNETLLWSYVS